MVVDLELPVDIPDFEVYEIDKILAVVQGQGQKLFDIMLLVWFPANQVQYWGL